MPDVVKKRRIWDNYVGVAEVYKADNLKLTFAAATREGFRCVNIREWYRSKQDSLWRPGRSSINFSLKVPHKDGSGLIEPAEDILRALKETIAVASSMELLDEANMVWVEYTPKPKKEPQKKEGPTPGDMAKAAWIDQELNRPDN